MFAAVLEPIDRFHPQLKSLAAAGLRLELGIPGDPDQLALELDQIRSALGVRVSLGQSLEDAIAQDARLPGRYRAAVQAWIRLGSPTAVLDAITGSKPLDRAVERGIRLSLLQTATTLALVSIAVAISSFWLSPRIEAVYVQLGSTPPASAQWLSAARAWLPVWVTIGTALFLFAGWLWYRSDGQWITRWATLLPMVRHRGELLSHARFADCLSTWLQQGLPLTDGIEFAAALSRDESVTWTRVKRRATRSSGTGASTEAHQQMLPLPPLLNWAIVGELADEPRWSALQSVAEIYRSLAERQVTAWTKLIPMVVAAGLCGLAVLAYGLGVFLPVIRLLRDISTAVTF